MCHGLGVLYQFKIKSVDDIYMCMEHLNRSIDFLMGNGGTMNLEELDSRYISLPVFLFFFVNSLRNKCT